MFYETKKFPSERNSTTSFLSSRISPPCPNCVCINHQLLLIRIYQVMFHGTLVPQKSPLKNKGEKENIPGTISLENTRLCFSFPQLLFFLFFSFFGRVLCHISLLKNHLILFKIAFPGLSMELISWGRATNCLIGKNFLRAGKFFLKSH